MKRKNYIRIGAAFMAFALTMQGMGNISPVLAAETNKNVRTATETQMSSEPENVYVNTYGLSEERTQNFDSNWKFNLGDTSGAEAATYDDSRWRQVSLPHDYSIEQEFSKSMEAESAYLPGGTGWYRKNFTVEESLRGKKLRVDFGGVYMNATIWVNGEELGTHPNGYTPFSYDITDYVKYGEENIIAVKVNHLTPSSRWYSGSGIYRSVYLTVTDEVYVDLYGTEVTTPNLETEAGSTVHMNVITTVVNDASDSKEVKVTHTVYEKDTTNSIGTVTTDVQTVDAGTTADITAILPADNPKLWNLDEPNLYTVRTEVIVDDEVVDTYDTEYGFRYFKFDNNTGFYLNGEPIKLKGVCMHHDQGSLGAEAYYRSIERQVEIMQEMGCNSIRVAHNPAADELIEICNEKGVLVIDEAFDGWMHAKNGNYNDYSNWFYETIDDDNEIVGGAAGMTWSEFDLKTMIKRGYNAPSIIMWSLGNEVWEGAGGTGYEAQAERLASMAHAFDATRPCTIGDNNLKHRNGTSLSMGTSLHNNEGVVGANYCSGAQYDWVHENYPDWSLYGSETASCTNSRGVYDTISDNSLSADKELTAYDYSSVGWGEKASQAWYAIITRDYLAGEYVWTGFDYLGEPTPANGIGSGAVTSWPSPKNSFFGIVDIAGIPKDSYYFYQSQWNDEVNTLHILPAWNEDAVYTNNAGKVPVVVYSDAAAVELIFTAEDGTQSSLGKKEFTQYTTDMGYTYQIYEGSDKDSAAHRNLYLTWYVPYEDGTITAVAYDKAGNVISDTEGRSYVTTTGDEAKLEAEVDRTSIDADGKDMAYITVNVMDEEGNVVPDASNRVTFDVDGDGVLVGVDNGKQADHQSYQDNNREAYNGTLVAIVQSTKEAGSFTVTAKADGLKSDMVTVTTVAADGDTAGEKQLKCFYMSKIYYAKTGSQLQLPETIETRYTDGTAEKLPVVWEEIDSESVNEVGTFSVKGIIDNKYSISVVVNMIDEIGGVLNYSTTTQKGVVPLLPDARPAVLADGTILDASFPVAWEDVENGAYNEAGIVVVEGTANVFGNTIDVTASVRVQEETITVGESISDAALTLTQDIESSLQSDNLDAVKDGSTAAGEGGDNGNDTIWTNYNSSQAGDDTAEITFEYATQQRIGEVVIHFCKDSYSARYPDAGTTKIYVSEDNVNWTEVIAKETIGEEVNGNVKPYTYSFNIAAGTFVKICITNKDEALDGRKTCTGISEIELKKATGAFTTYATADIASMTVNGKEVTDAELTAGAYYTMANVVKVDATGADNAAVTVLPAYEKQVLVIVESEDNKTRETFTIYLGQEKPENPSDASEDYDVTKITYSTGSEQSVSGNEGPISYAFDGNTETFWHSEWSPSWSTGQLEDYLWVKFELKEATTVDAIRYLPRGGNGDITSYRAEGSVDGETWITLTEGTWDKNDTDWKLAKFDATEVVALRLVATGTFADTGNNKFASARELRVRTSAPACEHTTELTGKTEPTCTEDGYTGDQVCTICGETAVYGDSVKATGHAWGKWIVEKEATTEEEGLRVRVCGICDETEEEKILKLEIVNPFVDVQDSEFYYNPILWGYSNGIVKGITETTFGPNVECKRGEIVTFIWRAAGEPTAEKKEHAFTDVIEGEYYYEAILWAVEKGIVYGRSADKFAPEEKCKRAEMATLLWRAAGEETAEIKEVLFTDITKGEYYYDAVLWATENGIINGYGNRIFGTEKNVTRGETVTMLHRYYVNISGTNGL